VKQQIVITLRYAVLQETAIPWQILNRPTFKHFFKQKYKKQQFFSGYNNLIEGLFVTQLRNNVGISVWQIVWIKTNCYFLSDTFLPWLGIPNTPQNNYLACIVSGLPNNVPAITHESGENQNPLRSLGYLRNTCQNVPTSIQKTSPPSFFKMWKYLTGQDKHNTDYVSENLRIYIYYQVVCETTFYIKKFQICFKIEKKYQIHDRKTQECFTVAGDIRSP